MTDHSIRDIIAVWRRALDFAAQAFEEIAKSEHPHLRAAEAQKQLLAILEEGNR